MSEELRVCLSEILVNAYKAFDLIPLPKNRDERRKIDDVMIVVGKIGDVLGLEVHKEVDVLIQEEMFRVEQKLDDECMLIWLESYIDDEDYFIDMERIILGGGI